VKLVAVALVLTVAAAGSATAAPAPTRAVAEAGPVTALSVTSGSVAYALAASRRDCGRVRLWDTATRALRTFGERTLRGCEERPSGGSGISQVATSGRRVFWVTHIGGNLTDRQLWTATTTRRAPRRLAFASGDTDGPSPIVLGPGTRDGVPYAVRDTVTYVADDGARRFRTRLEAPVRFLTAGAGAGKARVLAALADGRVVLLAGDGGVLRTDTYEPSSVRAIALGLEGPLVQVGRTVHVGPLAGGTTVVLPPGGLLLDDRQGWLVYRQGAEVRARRIATGEDVRLLTLPVKPWQSLHFSTDARGTAWARGATVSWRAGALP
jgi:hypothetical protein